MLPSASVDSHLSPAQTKAHAKVAYFGGWPALNPSRTQHPITCNGIYLYMWYKTLRVFINEIES